MSTLVNFASSWMGMVLGLACSLVLAYRMLGGAEDERGK
jgi:hypothetical protein